MVQHLLGQSACVADLKQRARRRIPQFAFNYVEGGCNGESALGRNRAALDALCLQPNYLAPYQAPQLQTTLFGRTYNAPLGIAPLGLTGIVWPHSSLMHAKAAKAANIPFILSTLSTNSIEQAAALAEENFWFQLYPPADLNIRKDLMRRVQAVGCQNLVVTIDVPAAGRRPRDIKSGLAVPPKITPRSIWQSCLRPQWSLATLRAGLPQFASIQPYIKDAKNMTDIAHYIRVTLKDVVDAPMLQQLRDAWPGKLIVKGILSAADAECALACGADGLIVSNHGGRQLDAAQASIDALGEIQALLKQQASDVTLMVDSGVETGVDIARFLAQGAQAVFAGRAFLYGVAAHGEQGAVHTVDLLRDELQQVMTQLHCAQPSDLRQHRKNLVRL